MAIPALGEPINGRTQEVKIGTHSVNCTGDVPLRPAMTEPSSEIQKFQNGSYVATEVDGSYGSSTVTCAYDEEIWEYCDTQRANGTPVECVLPGGFTGEAIPSVTEGPTIIATGTRIAQMAITLTWVSAKTPTGTGV